MYACRIPPFPPNPVCARVCKRVSVYVSESAFVCCTHLFSFLLLFSSGYSLFSEMRTILFLLLFVSFCCCLVLFVAVWFFLLLFVSFCCCLFLFVAVCFFLLYVLVVYVYCRVLPDVLSLVFFYVPPLRALGFLK